MTELFEDFDFACLEETRWQDAPIRPDWIVAGNPRARSAELSRSTDGLAWTAVWDCSAGTFTWRNYVDETVHIVEGGVIVTDARGRTRHLRSNDVVLFRAGTTFTWHVPDYVRKIAFMRSTVPPILGPTLRMVGRLQNGLARRFLFRQAA